MYKGQVFLHLNQPNTHILNLAKGILWVWHYGHLVLKESLLGHRTLGYFYDWVAITNVSWF